MRGALRPAAPAKYTAEVGGTLANADGRVWIQVRHGAGTCRSSSVPEYAAGWLAQVSDPGPLLGLPPAPGPADDSGALRQRRSQSFAEVQEHYYDHPRVSTARLARAPGRHRRAQFTPRHGANVAVLGHGHQVLADAVARQRRRLNTNRGSTMGRWAFRSGWPPPPDRWTPSSGERLEADDLALRLAWRRPAADIVAWWPRPTTAGPSHRRDLDVDRRQPQCVVDPAVVGPYRAVPELLPRRAPRDRRSKYAPEAVAIIEGLVAQGIHRRRSSVNRSRQRRRDGAARRLPSRPCMPRRAVGSGHRRRGSGGLWPHRTLVLGLRAAGGGARYRLRRQGDGQRPAAGRGGITSKAIADATAPRAISSPRPAAARSPAWSG